MLITDGIYNAKVTDAVWSPNKNKNGHYLKLELTIMDNLMHVGVKMWHYFNFDNPNDIARDLSQKSWANFCYEGKLGALIFDFKRGPDLSFLTNLIGHKTSMEIITRLDKDNTPRNKIKCFLPFNSATMVLPVNVKQAAEELFKKEEPTPDPNDYPASEKDYSDLNDDIPF